MASCSSSSGSSSSEASSRSDSGEEFDCYLPGGTPSASEIDLGSSSTASSPSATSGSSSSSNQPATTPSTGSSSSSSPSTTSNHSAGPPTAKNEPNGYIKYFLALLKEYPGRKVTDVAKIAGMKWSKLSAEQQEEWKRK